MADNIGNRIFITIGDKGAQGIQGIQGPQGIQGIQGEEGPQGIQGIQGPQGKKGSRGFVGEMGAQGDQGMQGGSGTQGPQGIRGCDGVQGAKGSNGVQGPQGEKGENGTQGIRGCDGVQGAKGSKGVQGPNGERGENGTQGAQGITGNMGAQGVRGVKGAQGARGEYGYQGDDGEVGIQGLTGEDGAIWNDGIRLNGYNTHLFVYNIQSGKFKPVADNVSPEGQHNYLYIRNGAEIKIWLDRNAYDLIKSSGEIVIDSVVNGELIETRYKAYYANNISIVGKISPERDLNGVIEFTFRNNGWYYSGGLLLSGGGGQGEYYGGKDIEIGDDSAIDTSLDNTIESSVNIGNIKAGDTIPAGSTLSEILNQMLVKEFQAASVLPTSLLNVSPLSAVYSVGDKLGVLNVSHTYTDGKFKPSDGYPENKFIEYNGASEINAGCTEGDTTYKYDGDTIDLDSGHYTDNTPLTEGVHEFSCQTEYGANMITAKTNLNNDSTTKIIGGNTNASKKAFKVWYNVYIKEDVIELPVDYSVLMTTENKHVLSSNDVLYDVEYNIPSRNSMVVIIPTVKDFTIANNLGSPATSEFKANYVGNVTDGNGVQYNVYYKTNLSEMVSQYKWLTFSNL